MGKIARETRAESYQLVPDGKRCQEILSVMSESSVLSARQIANQLGYSERNATAPRLTEMEQQGLVIEVEKIFDPVTQRYVAGYRKATEVEVLKFYENQMEQMTLCDCGRPALPGKVYCERCLHEVQSIMEDAMRNIAACMGVSENTAETAAMLFLKHRDTWEV